MAAVQVGIAGVLAVDGDGGIAQHGLGTGGGQLQHLAGLLDRVEQMPEIAVLLLILHLSIGDGGVAVGAPVDHAVAAVDEALVVQADKDLLDGLRAALVHSEALTLPVAAAAQLLELADDAVAVFGLPSPCTFEEAVAAHHLLGQALRTHGLHDLGLGGDGGVVGAGHPQGSVALHPLGADQDVLHGVVHGVAHVELAGDVRRGHDDGVGLLVGVGLRVEVAAIQPELVDAVFHLARIILLCEFFHRESSRMIDWWDEKSRPTERSMGRLNITAVPPKLHTALCRVPLDAPITWGRPGGDYSLSPPLLKSDSTPHRHTGFSAAPRLSGWQFQNSAHSFSLQL